MSTRDVDWELDHIWGRLQRIQEEVNKLMTAQDNINAAVNAIQLVVADLTNAVANIKAELGKLAVPVDTSALDSAVTALQAVQASVDALETPPPAPPAPPAPAV